MKSIRGLVGVLVCAALIALSGSATAGGAAVSPTGLVPPSGFFGVGGWSYPAEQQAASLSSAGLKLVRGALSWGEMQTSSDPSSRNWWYTDQLADEAAADGFNIVFTLNGCAVWACGAINEPPTGDELPAYESFVAAMAARYKPSSSFWNGKASIPTITYQVWNEVNGGYFWPDPTPAAYASFLSAVSQTIRSADPTAGVIMSGLTGLPGAGSSGGIALVPFLTGLYQQPGFTQSTDAIVVHGYANDPTQSIGILDAARRVMLANNDAAQPIWMTEIGWASGGPVSPFTVSETEQAAYLQQAFGTMLACAPRWNLQHALWFSLQDVSANVFGTADSWGYNSGLLDVNGNPKPSYSAFLQFIGSQPVAGTSTCTLPGGLNLAATSGASSTTPPPDGGAAGTRVAILSVRPLTNNRRSQPVSFAEIANGQVVHGAKFQCSLNGRRWQRCSSPFNAASRHQGENSLSVRVVAAPAAGPAPARVSWLVAFTPPRTVITSFAVSPTASNVLIASFTGIDNAGIAGYQCRLDTHAWKACTSPYSTPQLGTGLHTVRIRAIDRAGNRQRRATLLRFWVR